MAITTKDDLVKSVRTRKGDEIFTLEDAMKNVKLALCGANAGSFSFNDGDIVTIPEAKELKVRAKDKTFHKQTSTILSVTAQVNNNWEFVPIWAFRKRTPKQEDIPSQLSNDPIFSEMLRADDDLYRIQLLAGKTFKVKVLEAEVINPETEKPYICRLYLFEEMKQQNA